MLEHLRRQAGDGRLDVEELTRRTDAALAAVTIGDLRALIVDLPEASPMTSAGSARQDEVRQGSRWAIPSHLLTYLSVSVMLVAIWALSGAGYFWPIWPILGWGLCAVPRGVRGYPRPGRPRAWA